MWVSWCNLDHDVVAGEVLEARLLDVQAIIPGDHVHKLIQALVARRLNTLFLRPYVGEGDLSAGDGGSGGIHHGAIDRAERTLTVKGKRSRDHENTRHKQRPQIARRHTQPPHHIFRNRESLKHPSTRCQVKSNLFALGASIFLIRAVNRLFA